MTSPNPHRPALSSVPQAAIPTVAPAATPAATDEEDYVYPRPTALPRLGRGIVWANILADIERDNLRREGHQSREAA